VNTVKLDTAKNVAAHIAVNVRAAIHISQFSVTLTTKLLQIILF
jgi:hypothetical protein